MDRGRSAPGTIPTCSRAAPSINIRWPDSSIPTTAYLKQTIWDAGGYNVLDFSGAGAAPSGYRIDLKPIGWITTTADYRRVRDRRRHHRSRGGDPKVVDSVGSDTIRRPRAPTFAGYASNRVTGTDVIYGGEHAGLVGLVRVPALGLGLLVGVGKRSAAELRHQRLGAV